MTTIPDLPVYVISLGSAAERRQFVTSEFKRLGVDVEIVEAIDGSRLTHVERNAYSDWRAWFSFGRSLLNVEIAIALSHLRAYEQFLASSVDEVLICEDDIRPTRALLQILARRSELPADRSIVTMYSMFPSATAVPLGTHEIVPGHRVCRYARLPFGSQCYLLTRRAAERLLRVAYPIRLPADHMLFQNRPAKLAPYGITPNVIENEGYLGAFAPLGDRAQAFNRQGSILHRAVRMLGAPFRRRSVRQVAGPKQR